MTLAKRKRRFPLSLLAQYQAITFVDLNKTRKEPIYSLSLPSTIPTNPPEIPFLGYDKSFPPSSSFFFIELVPHTTNYQAIASLFGSAVVVRYLEKEGKIEGGKSLFLYFPTSIAKDPFLYCRVGKKDP